MSQVAPNKTPSLDDLIHQFEDAQEETVARFDGLISAARKLQKDNNLFEEVIENSLDAIFVVEIDSGIIKHVNEAASRMLGYEVEDLKGRRQLTFFPRELRRDLIPVFRQIRQDGALSNLPTRLMNAQAQEIDVSISAVVLPGDHQGLVVGFARDISEQVKAEEDLRALNESLESRVAERTAEIEQSNEELEMAIREANRHAGEADEANRAKSLFIANMTHEIRTPLNSVMGLLDLLLETELGEKQKETAEVISQSAKTLGYIINDILDFSKIEAGKLELEKLVFVLPELFQQTMNSFLQQAREKGLQLDLVLDDDLPEFAIGDPGRLRQVLLNLLSNAIKFTSEGSVTLDVQNVSLEGQRHTVRIAVRDTGIGIPEEYMKDLFTPFTQADTSVTRKFGGTGLGLNISGKLVAKMGGQLEAESREGQGSSFFFNTHFEKAAPDQVTEMQHNQAKESPEVILADIPTGELRILLVEDNKLNQRVAQGMLSILGCQSTLAENGLLALECLAEEEFDLVFMDLQMPEMGGLEVVEKLRQGQAGQENRNVPVIAMTAHASRQDRKDCLAAGMNDYVPKPISSLLIAQAIQRALEPANTSSDMESDSSTFNIKPLLAQSDGDVGIVSEVMDQFMTNARRSLNLMIGALQNYDFGFATQEARSLESRALSIHCQFVVDLTGELIKAVETKQQELALEVAEEIKAELNNLESVI